MVILPKEKPLITNLNSYYLDVGKLIEHYQGEFGSGAVHFKSGLAEGVIFFDRDEILNGVLQDRNGEVEGEAAVERLERSASQQDFRVSIYKIDGNKIHFWANAAFAEVLYRDLNAEFTDLPGLMKKMETENLTGCIEVFIGDGEEGGVIFYNSGHIIGGSYTWGRGGGDDSARHQEILVEKVKEWGGIFNVRRISVERNKGAEAAQTEEARPSSYFVPALEELLNTFEDLITSEKRIHANFNTMLKKMFLEKVDTYPFLDPFAAELSYVDRKLEYLGNTDGDLLARGVMESVRDLAGQLDLLPSLRTRLKSWSRKYEKEIAETGTF